MVSTELLCFFSISVLLAVAERGILPFQRLAVKIVGEILDEFSVDDAAGCAVPATGLAAAGFRLEPIANGFLCTIFKKVRSFEPSDGRVSDFLPDCTVDQLPEMCQKAKTVKQILHPLRDCREHELEEICNLMRELKVYCDTIDDENCVRGPSCPQDFTFSPDFERCVAVRPLLKVDKTQAGLHQACTNSGCAAISIHSQKQNDALQKLAAGEDVLTGYQIPAHQPWTREGFLWADGTNKMYENFDEREPGNQMGEERTVVLQANGYWNDQNIEDVLDNVRKIACACDVAAQ